MSKATPSILKFLREAGRKGGKKSSKHPRRRELNRKAAQARWRKQLPKPKTP